jgi:sugar phosphate isomerase/epimerase
VLPDMTYEDARQHALEAFTICGRAAERHGVMFCLEPLTSAETNLMTSAREVIGFVRAVNLPHLQMMLDVKAMSAEERPMPDVIREAAPHLRYVHCNDANLRGPGFGATDFVPVFGALKEIGYGGYASVEVFDYSPDPQTIATQSLDYMRRVAAQVGL